MGILILVTRLQMIKADRIKIHVTLPMVIVDRAIICVKQRNKEQIVNNVGYYFGK
jgi:hypothetical protein